MSDEPPVVVEALGVAVGIAADPDATTRLRRQWSRALTDAAPETTVDLRDAAIEDGVATDYAIASRVTLAALTATAGTRLNLHAGGVSDDGGRALAVVGASGTGKTTAISLLARRLGYVSDETVSIDEQQRIRPHPKPLSVITDPREPRVKHSISPDDLELLRPPEHTRLHRIVMLERGDDDEGLVPLAPARALAGLVEQTSSLTLFEHPVHRMADTIDACGGVWSLRYTECEPWVDDLVDLLDREPQPAPARVHHPAVHPAGHSGADADDVPDDCWSRLEWKDAEEYADELVLMVGDTVHVLGGLGVVIWLALATPRTIADLITEAESLWGEHPSASTLVLEALDVMADSGLVRPPRA